MIVGNVSANSFLGISLPSTTCKLYSDLVRFFSASIAAFMSISSRLVLAFLANESKLSCALFDTFFRSAILFVIASSNLYPLFSITFATALEYAVGSIFISLKTLSL